MELSRPGRAAALIQVLAVWSGGALGTAARYLVGLAVPPQESVPVPTLTVNLGGAFLLGVLLTLVPARTPDARGTVRLLLGTGFLGGFTTYSTLALDTVALAGGHPETAVGYAVGTVVLGVLASTAGISVRRWLARHPR